MFLESIWILLMLAAIVATIVVAVKEKKARAQAVKALQPTTLDEPTGLDEPQPLESFGDENMEAGDFPAVDVKP